MRSIITYERLMQELETGIRGRLCVQAWLGYGKPLFLGFGDQVLPPFIHGPDGENDPPPYELQTSYSDWIVEEQSVVRGTMDDPRDKAEAACELLKGRRVLDWQLNVATWSLTVYFEGDLVLKVVPWEEGVEDDPEPHAWLFRNPADEYLGVTRDGKLDVWVRDEAEYLAMWEQIYERLGKE